MITIWVAYFVAAAAASGVFIVAGWRSKQAHSFTSARVGQEMPLDPLWDEADSDFSEPRPQADAGTALRTALKRLAPIMANRSVQADVAASFGLMVEMNGSALVDLLEEMIGAAIHAAPASRILLTAAADRGRVAISVTDDFPNADPDVRRASVRTLLEKVAANGGTLDIVARPYEGTTMTLRLAAVPEDQANWSIASPSATPDLIRQSASV